MSAPVVPPAGPVPPVQPVTITLARLPVAKSNHKDARAMQTKTGKWRAQLYVSKFSRAFQGEVEAALAPTVASLLGAVFEGPVQVEMLITYQHYLKDGTTERKNIPDVDGGMKAVMDAGQVSGLYGNDRQVWKQTSSRRPGALNETVITFSALETGAGYALPSVAGRKEWAERKRGNRLEREQETYVTPGEAVARCWSCDILIGTNRIEPEIYLFVGAPGRANRLAGAVVCGTCAGELGLSAGAHLAHASALARYPQAERARVLAGWAESLLGPKPVLLFAKEARDLIRRRRDSVAPQEPPLQLDAHIRIALDRLDALRLIPLDRRPA